SDQVVFSSTDSAGRRSTVTVSPASVAADGSSLTVVVPDNATTGAVRLAREAAGLYLQVVPVLDDVSAYSPGYPLHGYPVSLSGRGYVEAGTVLHFGTATISDSSASSGPDIYDGYDPYPSYHANAQVSFYAPAGLPAGPVSVTTLGGTSAPFGLTFTGI